MVKKRGKEIYQPPYAQDLSGFSANGQVQPMGICENGSNPTPVGDWCSDGTTPTQDPSACNPTGTLPARAGCNYGNSAAEGCSAGSVVQIH